MPTVPKPIEELVDQFPDFLWVVERGVGKHLGWTDQNGDLWLLCYRSERGVGDLLQNTHGTPSRVSFEEARAIAISTGAVGLRLGKSRRHWVR